MDDKPSLQTMIEEANKAVARLKEIDTHPNWKKNTDSPCQMFTMEVDGRTASKGMIVVNYSLEQVSEFLKDVTVLKKLNPTINKIEVVHQYNDEIKINYQSYDGMWPVAGRDMILLGVRRNEENKLFLAAKSIAYPCPEVKGVVRGELFIGGWILERIDQNKTKVSYFADIDIKGSIPGMIKNKLSERQGSMPAKLEAEMKKAMKE